MHCHMQVCVADDSFSQINPASRSSYSTDKDALIKSCNAVFTLALLYWFTGETRYKAKVSEFIHTWFIEEATRMNPNLEYAQFVFHRNPAELELTVDGTGTAIQHSSPDGFSILDGRIFAKVLDGIAPINDRDSDDEWAEDLKWTETYRRFGNWLTKYFTWLLESRTGMAARGLKNNHGTWYDAQLCHIALFLGRQEVATEILATALRIRVEAQIDPSGHQPHERSRTKPAQYEIFNMLALSQLAKLGEAVGVDYWSHVTEDGRGMIAALNSILGDLIRDSKAQKICEVELLSSEKCRGCDVYEILYDCTRRRSKWLPKVKPASYNQIEAVNEILFGGVIADKALLDEDVAEILRECWAGCSVKPFQLAVNVTGGSCPDKFMPP
jgi:hypothetical protein